jgi:hypothetical protein
MRLGKGDGAAAAFLEINTPFSRITSQEGIFEGNSDKPLRRTSFSQFDTQDLF